MARNQRSAAPEVATGGAVLGFNMKATEVLSASCFFSARRSMRLAERSSSFHASIPTLARSIDPVFN